MAAASGVGDATPVNGLVALGQGEDEIAGVGAVGRRPDSSEGVGKGLAAQDAGLDPRLDRAEVAVELPATGAQVAYFVSGTEAQAVGAPFDHGHRVTWRLSRLGAGQRDAGSVLEPTDQ